MKALPPIDLSRIRDHAGAKDRGFEELAYLLAWDLEGLDRGTEIERRGTPDGGIEFSCLPVGRGKGGRWAWQAKYLFKFDASTFTQMTKSVVAALDSTPDLERYIFVLPKDRSTAALTKWNKAVADWTKRAKAKGMAVEFVFRGESQIVAAATSDQHAGAIRYFFDETFLTKNFMANQIDREVKNLGERYSPEVNVETETRSIVDAACRGPRFVEALRNLLSSPVDSRPRVDSQSDLRVRDRRRSARTSELSSTSGRPSSSTALNRSRTRAKPSSGPSVATPRSSAKRSNRFNLRLPTGSTSYGRKVGRSTYASDLQRGRAAPSESRPRRS